MSETKVEVKSGSGNHIFYFLFFKPIGLLSTWVLNLLKAVNETRVGYAK